MITAQLNEEHEKQGNRHSIALLDAMEATFRLKNTRSVGPRSQCYLVTDFSVVVWTFYGRLKLQSRPCRSARRSLQKWRPIGEIFTSATMSSRYSWRRRSQRLSRMRNQIVAPSHRHSPNMHHPTMLHRESPHSLRNHHHTSLSLIP